MQAKSSERLADQVSALAAELRAYAAELPTAANNSTPHAEEPRALSTREAARLLGVTPYTLNEWARLGRIRCRQDSPGGRRYWHRADLADYEERHSILTPISHPSYSSRDGNKGRPSSDPTPARAHTSGICPAPQRDPDHGRQMGTRRARPRHVHHERPYTPGSATWRSPPTPEKP